MINLADEDRELTLDLRDVGILYAGRVRVSGEEKWSVMSRQLIHPTVHPHGVMPQELVDTIKAGVYSSKTFGRSDG